MAGSKYLAGDCEKWRELDKPPPFPISVFRPKHLHLNNSLQYEYEDTSSMAMAKVITSSITSSAFRSRKHRPRQLLLIAIILLLPALTILGAISWWRQHEDDLHLPARNYSMQKTDQLKATNTMDEKDNGQQQQKFRHGSEQHSVKYIQVPSGRDDVQRYAAIDDSTDESISIREWLKMVYTDSPPGRRAASDLSTIIASSPYKSLLFETPGTSWMDSTTTPFEFALVNEPALQSFAEKSPNRDAFAEYFDASSTQDETMTVCSFPNLGGDATLISPLPPRDADNDASYSHLAIYVRSAPKNEVAEFWKVAATKYLRALEEKHPQEMTWFSTNGMGVAWLHLRVDDRPKYYSYAPFKH